MPFFFFHPPGTLELVFCRIHLIFFFFISLPFCAHLCWDWFDSTWWVGLGFSQPDHNTAVRCHKKLSWLKLVMLKDFCLVQKQVMGFVWDNSLRSNRCYLSTKSFSVFFSASQASIFSSSFLECLWLLCLELGVLLHRFCSLLFPLVARCSWAFLQQWSSSGTETGRASGD